MTIKRFLMLTLPAAGFSLLYSYPWYWGDMQASHEAIYPPIRPFVYRALMPWIAQAVLWLAPVRLDALTLALIALSGAAFIVGLWYWTGNEIASVLLFCGYVVAFCRYPKIYDLASAALWTFCLLFLQRGQYLAYLIVFVLACLNRETAVLLVPVSLVYLWVKK